MSMINKEQVLYRAHPSMWRNRPILFVICMISVILWGLGLLVLIPWWLVCLNTTITVTSRRTILRRGILAKITSEVLHRDVRNVQVSQMLLQRFFNVGDVAISSSGQGDVEIAASGLPSPARIRKLLDDFRFAN